MIKNIIDVDKLIEEMIASGNYMVVRYGDEQMLIKKPQVEEFKFTMFHGTSRYMLDKLSTNEENHFCEKSKMDYKYSLEVIKCLMGLVGEKPIDDFVKLLVNNIYDKENKSYEYENMCLTTDIFVAKRYAEEFQKVGELNSCILNLYKEAEKYRVKIPDKYMEYIKELKTAEKSEGLVLFVKELSYKDVCMSEGEEIISFDKLFKDTINEKGLNIHYHGPDTMNIETVSLDQLGDRYRSYRKELKEKLDRLKVYPLRNEEFESENIKSKVKIYKYYRYLF